MPNDTSNVPAVVAPITVPDVQAKLAADIAKPEPKPAAKPRKPAKPAKLSSGIGTPGQRAGTHISPNGKQAKPASTTAKPSKRNAKPETETAKPSGNVNRTAATVARNATNFGGTLSDRDVAYLAFYAGFAKRHPGKPVTVRELADSGRKPAYNGSAKAHDAGVINRLRKAGLLSVAADGTSFTFTKAATTHKAYSGAKA